MEEMNKLTVAQTLHTYFYIVKYKPLGQPDWRGPEQLSEAWPHRPGPHCLSLLLPNTSTPPLNKLGTPTPFLLVAELEIK